MTLAIAAGSLAFGTPRVWGHWLGPLSWLVQPTEEAVWSSAPAADADSRPRDADPGKEPADPEKEPADPGKRSTDPGKEPAGRKKKPGPGLSDNFGLSRVLEHLGVQSPRKRTLSGALLALAGTTLTLAVLWRRRAAGAGGSAVRDCALTGLGCLLFLLSAPLVWQHYLLLTAPLILLLLRPDDRPGETGWPRLGRRLLAVFGFAAVAIDPFSQLLAVSDTAAQATVAIAGLLALGAATLWDLGGDVRSPLAAGGS